MESAGKELEKQKRQLEKELEKQMKEWEKASEI
jgi:hypothetical protein